MSKAPIPAGFPNLLKEIKVRIQQSQARAVLAVNAELVHLYWDIGRIIDAQQREQGWGAAVIPRLARELRNELPAVKGFSERNIGRMIAFYRDYHEPDGFLPPPVARLPAPEKDKRPASSSTPKPILPQPVAKLPRVATVPQAAAELPDSLRFRHRSDRPSIGLILCQDRNQVVAEYALRGATKPIGISEYELTRALPAGLRSALPTVEEIEAELSEVATQPLALQGTHQRAARKSKTTKARNPDSATNARNKRVRKK
jgi:DUF1016 N-terminal domain/YhcG PDDEXK nuclease domain